MTIDNGETGHEWQRLYRAQLELRDALTDEADPSRRRAIIEQVRTNQVAISNLERPGRSPAEREEETLRLDERFRSFGAVSPPEDDSPLMDIDELFASLGLDEPINELVIEDVMTQRTGPERAASGGAFEKGTVISGKLGRSRLMASLIGALGAALLIVLGTVTWLLVSSDGGNETAADDLAATGAEPESDLEAEAEELRGVLGRLGLSDTMVEVQGSTLHVIGSVPSEQDLSAVRSAVVSLSSPAAVDLTAVVVSPSPGGGQALAPGQPPPPPGGGGPPPPGAQLPPGVPVPSADQQAALQTALDEVLLETPLVFDPGSVTLNEQQLELLNSVVIGLLEDNPGVPVNLVGYTDESGGEYENQLLSFERATAVQDYLIASGVPEFIVRAEGRGEDDPSGDAGADRRVEIEVVALG